MKRAVTAVSVLFVLSAVPGWAQEISDSTPAASSEGVSQGAPAPTAEMWLYQQYKSDYQDPKMAVRKKAEFRARQRLNRLAALKWFGFSNQRPTCTSDPFHGDWSAAWRSNNSFYPSRWQGTGYGWIVVRPEHYGTSIR